MNTKTSIQRRPGRHGELRVAAINRVADRIDLAIDLLTLGQYGLECREVTAGNNVREAGCEGSKRRVRQEPRIAWEAPRQSRRSACEWPWPQRPAPSGRPAA